MCLFRLQVYVQINGVDAPYHMKVGDTGEAFFVFETDQDVPADLQTSPLTGPTGDDGAEEVNISTVFNLLMTAKSSSSPNHWISEIHYHP